MKKVVHILRYYGHPNQSYTTKLLESLSQDTMHFEHVVVCDSVLANPKTMKVLKTNPYKAFFYKPLQSLLALKQVFFDTSLKKLSNKSPFKKTFKWAIKWQPLWQLKPEVVHIHHLQVVDKWVLEYLKSKNINCILSLRGMELMRETLNNEDQKVFLEKINCVNQVHVISQFMYDYALEKNIPEHKLIKVYRGFDKDQILPENIKTTQYNKNEVLNIIAVGRLAWEKGHDQLLESIARLKQLGYKINLDVYGEGPLDAFLKLRANQLGLTSEVCFKGQIPNIELKKQYKKYHVAVQPSLFEALSNGLLDMALHQLPCVVSNIGGMPEIIHHEVNGMVYKPENPEALDQAILKALQLDQKKIKDDTKSLSLKFSLENELEGLNKMYQGYS